MKNQWGFTDDPKELEKITAFREAAVKDGWKIYPTYSSELIDSHATLEKDGFKMMINSRSDSLHKFESDIFIWGPDGMSLKPSPIYSWDAIKAGVNVCGFCGAIGVKTRLVAFANRSCEKCYPEAKKKLEYPGWCD